MVTGASAGALIAPFAFLGPSYDPVLKNLFSEGIGEELLQIDGLSAIFGAGVFKTEPLKRLIARYVDDALLERIGAEYQQGPAPAGRHHQSRRAAHRRVGHGRDRGERRARRARSVPRRAGGIRERAGRLFAGADQCGRRRPPLRGDACRWRRARQPAGRAGIAAALQRSAARLAACSRASTS